LTGCTSATTWCWSLPSALMEKATNIRRADRRSNRERRRRAGSHRQPDRARA
jgi:hypothetical protein